MSAPEGNDYYKLRTKDGRERIFDKPQDLLKACNEYFEWCLANPLKEEQLFHYQGTVVSGEASKMRAFTLYGLCGFIDVSYDGFRSYEQREGFIEITTRVREIIYNQKFEGAASGFFNANIIARDLGLIDKQHHDVKTEQPLFPDVKV